jgi:hypothetical protein
MSLIGRSGRRPGDGLGHTWSRIRGFHVNGTRGTLRGVDGETHPSESDNVRGESRGIEVVRESGALGFAGDERGGGAGEPSWSGADRAHTFPERIATRRPQRTAGRLEQLEID